MIMIKWFAGRLAPMLALAVVVAAACDRSTVEPPGHELLGTVEILDRSTVPATLLATWTHAGGWDQEELMTLSHATEGHRTRASLEARMWSRGGDPIQLSEDGEHSVRYGPTEGSADIIDMDESRDLFHGDHVHIYGYDDGRTGTAQIVFALWHGGHSDGETDAIDFTITD